MSVDIEKIKAEVLAAIEPQAGPSHSQVSKICELTYREESRKEIQRVIDRRLKSPDKHKPLEVLNTLILLQHCLPDASSDFITFCTNQVQLVEALTRYRGSDSPAGRDAAARICSRADKLSQFLLDPVQLADQRREVSARSTSGTVPPVIYPRIAPLPTSPMDKGKAPLTPQGSHLPSPGPTPPQPFLGLKANDKVNSKKMPLRHGTISASVFHLRKEDVAAMTFKSGQEGMDAVVTAVNGLTRSGSSADDLVKVLTCVHHCLYWGSAPFVALCREKKAIFNGLLKHSVAQVRGHADAIVSLLNDHSRLQEARRSRSSLMPKTAILSAKTESEATAEAIRQDMGRMLVLEPAVDISRCVTKLGTQPFAGGGYSDVWKGIYRTETSRDMVAIKFLRRLSKVPVNRLQKRLNREIRVWRTLLHKNISLFYGIILERDAVGMVSPFYSNGNVLEYVKLNPNINPLAMLQEIADGVAYLHEQSIVHGDIKCANVMVSDEGTPKLIDFGLSQVIDGYAEITGYTTSNLASSLRWSAPELLIGDTPVSSKSDKSDIYAFASTCIEVMTLECPYPGLREPQVLKHVAIEGKTPERPPMTARWSPSDDLWYFLISCWKVKPRERPNIVAVRRKLAEFYNGTSEDIKLATPVHSKSWD